MYENIPDKNLKMLRALEKAHPGAKLDLIIATSEDDTRLVVGSDQMPREELEEIIKDISENMDTGIRTHIKVGPNA